MIGTIIAVNLNQIEISAAGKIYQAALSADIALPKPGDEAEFETLLPATILKKGSAKLSAITAKHLPEVVAWSKDNEVEGHRIVEFDSSLRLCAEGPDFAACYQELAREAQSSKANALLQLKTDYIKRPLHGAVLCRASAVPAQIDGERFKAPPGLKLTLPLKYLRRNSPNGAALRYRRVLLLCLLLIVEPLLAGLMQRGVLPLLLGQALLIALPIFCLALAFCFNPRQRRIYLFKPRL